MADDKARADKLAAARKKAQKKAAEAKAKKAGGKPTAAKEEETATTTAAATEEVKEEDSPTPAPAPAAEEEQAVTDDTPAEPEPDTAPAAVDDEPAASASDPTPLADMSALEDKIAELEKECAAARSARDEAQLMADALEKKVASLEMLHKEDEGQIKRLQSDLSEAQNEGEDLRTKLAKAEAEALRLSKKDAQDGGGANDDLDELEDEERKKLEGRIRELEAENGELRRGVWLDKRRDMQPAMEDMTGQFTNVDLSAGALSPGAQRRQAGGGFGDFFTSGLTALTGAGGHQAPHGHEPDDDGFLDDEEDFDEEAFRKAQEEAAKARIERIKEVKRGLKNWEGWRLDLVEGRSGGGEGIGEIFEV